jgi:nucleotide-binding universal stress UspA family protein
LTDLARGPGRRSDEIGSRPDGDPSLPLSLWCYDDEGGWVPGTLVCAVTEGEESADALILGAELSERLGLRLVLAHAVDGISGSANGDGDESVTSKADRQGAERRLARLADEHDLADRAERRVAVGDPAAWLGRIAAEEAADLIVVGARARGWRRRLESRLADELESATRIPVLIAPPQGRRAENVRR